MLQNYTKNSVGDSDVKLGFQEHGTVFSNAAEKLNLVLSMKEPSALHRTVNSQYQRECLHGLNGRTANGLYDRNARHNVSEQQKTDAPYVTAAQQE